MDRGQYKGFNSLTTRINSLEDIGMGSLRTPIQTVERSDGYEVQRIWDRVNLSSQELSNLPIETVDMSNLYSWQRVVNKDILLKMVKQPNIPHSSDLPVAILYKNKLVLVDGNHRVALDSLKGKKSVRVRVYGR